MLELKNRNVLQIGITGGIGSGKSIICKVFRQLLVPIYDADTRAKWVLNNDLLLKDQIIQAFGPSSYNSESVLDRKYIASEVFKDGDKVNTLNELVHPRVAIDYKEWLESTVSPVGYVIKEAALLIESGSFKYLDKTINVEASKEIRIQRVLKRDPFRTKEELNGIISKQISDEERKNKSDYTIVNNDRELITTQVIRLHEIFLLLSESGF